MAERPSSPDSGIDEVLELVAAAAWELANEVRGTRPLEGDAASGAISTVMATAASALASHLGPDPQLVDLTVGTGFSLAVTAKTLGVDTAPIGIDLAPERADRAKGLLANLGLNLEAWAADTLTAPIPQPPPAGLVLVDPPFGMRLSTEEASDLGLDATALEWAFVYRGLQWLRPGGYLLAVLPYGAAWQRSGREARRHLLDADLIHSVIHLPGGLMRMTGVPVSLWVLTNEKPAKIRGKVQIVDLRDLAERETSRGSDRRLRAEGLSTIREALLKPKDSKEAELVKIEDLRVFDATATRGHRQWRTRVAGGRVEMHALRYGGLTVTVDIKPDSAWSLDLHSPRRRGKSEQTIESICQLGDWPVTRLEAVVERRSGSRGPEDGDSYHFYLPRARAQRVTRDAPDRHAAGVDVDLTLVEPDFLVAWLNTDAGRQAREAAVGETNYHFGALRLDDLIIPLPPLEAQREILHALTSLDKAETVVKRAREAVWAEPDDPSRGLSRLSAVLDESIISWAGELPYPIGSALWALNAKDGNPGDRLEHLLHIWEAYASFMGTVLLSATATNPERFKPDLDAIAEALRKARLDFRRASFGTWKVVIERVSKTFRSYLAEGDKRETALGDLGGPPRAAAERILHRDVAVLLGEVAQQRNTWFGHTGAVADVEKVRRADAIETLLLRLREVVGDAWTALPLIRSKSLNYREGTFYSVAEKVMGFAPPFKRERIAVGSPIEDHALYLCAPGAATPLPLVGFLQLMESPRDEANICYFFNRMQSPGEARLVSYQLSQTSERLGALDSAAVRIIDALSAKSVGSEG